MRPRAQAHRTAGRVPGQFVVEETAGTYPAAPIPQAPIPQEKTAAPVAAAARSINSPGLFFDDL